MTEVSARSWPKPEVVKALVDIGVAWTGMEMCASGHDPFLDTVAMGRSYTLLRFGSTFARTAQQSESIAEGVFCGVEFTLATLDPAVSAASGLGIFAARTIIHGLSRQATELEANRDALRRRLDQARLDKALFGMVEAFGGLLVVTASLGLNPTCRTGPES